MHETGDGSAEVEVLVFREEPRFIGSEVESARERESVVRQVEPASIGEHVGEMGIHVKEAAAVDERQELPQLPFDSTHDRGGVRRAPQLVPKPLAEREREVLEEQDRGARAPPGRLGGAGTSGHRRPG